MSLVPGPKGHPLHGSWREFRDDPLAFLRKGTLEYGDFFRFRLGLKRCFAIADPAAILAVFTDQEGFTDKTPPHRMDNAYPRAVSRLEGKEHLDRRRALVPAFQREGLLARAAAGARVARAGVRRLRTGSVQSILPLMEDVALRSAVVLLMGASGEHVVDRITLAQPRVEAWLGNSSNDEEAYRRDRDALAEAILEAARHRRAGPRPAHTDLLDPLIAMVDAGRMTEEELIDEVVMMLVTHVASGAVVTWALHEIAKRPDLQRLLGSEIGALPVQGADVDGAALLSAVLLETLRLHPPVYVLVREARRDFRHGAIEVSAGSEVIVSPYVMQRLPRFWKRPDELVPERFLPGSAAHGERPFAAFIPFGLGLRKCIGERTSLLQMKIMLAAVLQEYELSLPAGYVPPPADRPPISPRAGLPLVIEQRRGQAGILASAG